jgi:hypothetical protein
MNWSYSAAKAFAGCQKLWYYRHILANSRSSLPIEREAYVLSKLQSLSAWRGQVVDQVITQRLIPALNRGETPTLKALLREARDIFEAQLAFGLAHRVREPGMRSSKAAPTFAAFFNVEYGLPIPQESIDEAWCEIRASFTALFSMSEVRARLRNASYRAAQRKLWFDLDGIKVRAVPDVLVFSDTGPPLIVDWKVHATASRDYRLQLTLYALALTRSKSHADFPSSPEGFSPTQIDLLEVQLLTGTARQFVLDDADVLEAQNYVAETSNEMTLALRMDTEGPLRPDDFESTHFPGQCERCSFRKICWEATNGVA